MSSLFGSCVLLGSDCLQVSVNGPTASMLSTWGFICTFVLTLEIWANVTSLVSHHIDPFVHYQCLRCYLATRPTTVCTKLHVHCFCKLPNYCQIMLYSFYRPTISEIMLVQYSHPKPVIKTIIKQHPIV